MRRLTLVKEGNRVVGSTISRIGFAADQIEEAEAEAAPVPEEAEANAVSGTERAEESVLEWEKFALNANNHHERRRFTLTEASDIMYRIMKLAAVEVGVSPDELAGRVDARLRVDRKKRRWADRLVQGDEEAWANRI